MEKQHKSKRHCREGDESWDEFEFDAEWHIAQFQGDNNSPETYRVVRQQSSVDSEVQSSYVFIYHLPSRVGLMDRKVGGALAWLGTRFQHMQNISTLDFSVQLGKFFGRVDER